MTLVQLIVLVVVLILIFWLLTRYVAPALPAPWGTVILVVVALLVILWLLSFIGLLPAMRVS